MLEYCTHLCVNETLEKDILCHMFIDWIQNSFNKMEGLEYDGSYDYEYEVNQKVLNIHDFKEQDVLGLKFINKDNNRNMTFIVDLTFDYIGYTIDMRFYVELDDRSTYHGIKGIPNIFKILLGSEYMKDDGGMSISIKPHYMSRYEYDHMISQYHGLPIVVLNKNYKENKLCAVNPNILAEKLYGIAHVVVINDSNMPSVRIVYPNTYKEEIAYHNENKMIAMSVSCIRDYLKKVNSEYYSFDELMNMMYFKKYELSEADHLETYKMFEDEVEGLRDIVEQLKADCKQLNEELMLLTEREKQLKHKLDNKKEVLLYTTKTDYDEDQKQLMRLLKKIYGNFEPKTPYRKIPVLKSIIGGQE